MVTVDMSMCRAAKTLSCLIFMFPVRVSEATLCPLAPAFILETSVYFAVYLVLHFPSFLCSLREILLFTMASKHCAELFFGHEFSVNESTIYIK